MRNLKRITLVVIIVTYFLINTSLAKTGNINAQAARLRKENNTSSNIITNVYKGEEVEILEESGDWYKVKYQNNTGYIKKEFITEKVTNTNTNTSTNTQSNTNGNVAASQNNTVQNTNTQNTLAQNTNNQNQNTSAKNTNTQNVANDNKQQTNNQSSENSELVFVSTSAKLRIVPNLMSNKIEKIEAGKQLTKVSEVKNWVQVTDGNIIGWLPKSKITTSSTSEVSNTNTPEIPVETNTSNTTNSSNTTNTTNTVNNVGNTSSVNTIANNVANDVSNNTTASNNQSQTTSNKTGKVNVETAKVREKANQSSKFVSLLDYGDTVTIIAEEGDWYQITAGSTSGYIKKTLVTVSDKNISSRSSSEERAPIDNKEDVKVDQETNKAVSSMLSSETSKVT